MGLLKGLVLLPLAPIRGVVWIAERIADQAEREMHGDAAKIRREMRELALAREAGEISVPEFAAAEDALLERLSGLGEPAEGR